MKQIIISLTFLFALSCNAQIVTRSSLDTNNDGNVTKADVDSASNGVLGKAADSRVVTTGTSHSTLSALDNCMTVLQDKMVDLAMKGVYNYGPNIAGREYVDLGLPSGIKWATRNIGARAPEDYGYYFAWGDTVGYTCDIIDGHSFGWASYKWGNSATTMTKYCTDSSYGTVDNKTTLELADDAAHAKWGDPWRMPTDDECVELKLNCYWEYTSNYKDTGRSGYIVYKAKSDADKGIYKIYDGTYKYVNTTIETTPSLENAYTIEDTHIFLPIVGYRNGVTFYEKDSSGKASWSDYWTSSQTSTNYTKTINSSQAFCMYFGPDEVRYNNGDGKWDGGLDRWYGFAVRAVFK